LQCFADDYGYRKGVSLTVTDANVLLGCFIPEYFPKIPWKSDNEALGMDASKIAFEKLAEEINKAQGGKALLLDGIVYGWVHPPIPSTNTNAVAVSSKPQPPQSADLFED
jgi:N-methylhydantoinase A/oxoprolinase/acetone carboxylase beta subunit